MQATEQESHLEEVKLAMGAYGEMASIVCEGHQFKVMMMAIYMATMMSSLLSWGVLTEAEVDELMAHLQEKTRENRAAHEAATYGVSGDDILSRGI